MKDLGSCTLLVLMLGCGEPWVSLGVRAPSDGATAEAGATADGSALSVDAAVTSALPEQDAAVGSHTNDGEHGCVDKTQCTSGGHPFCDTAQGVCVRCLRDLDCDPMDLCAAGDCVSRN